MYVHEKNVLNPPKRCKLHRRRAAKAGVRVRVRANARARARARVTAIAQRRAAQCSEMLDATSGSKREPGEGIYHEI